MTPYLNVRSWKQLKNCFFVYYFIELTADELVWTAPFVFTDFLPVKKVESSITGLISISSPQSFKNMFELKKEYPKLAKAFLHSMQRHTWYLTEELVLLCLGDDDIEDGQKMAMLRKLMEFEISDTKVGKPKLPEISESTELIDLIGPTSWTLLKVARLGVENVKQWIN